MPWPDANGSTGGSHAQLLCATAHRQRSGEATLAQAGPGRRLRPEGHGRDGHRVRQEVRPRQTHSYPVHDLRRTNVDAELRTVHRQLPAQRQRNHVAISCHRQRFGKPSLYLKVAFSPEDTGIFHATFK